MASILTLDRSDPGVDELVAGWKDGGDYVVQVKITQDKSSANVASYTVTEVSDLTAEAPAEEEVEEVEEMPVKKMPKGGMVPK